MKLESDASETHGKSNFMMYNEGEGEACQCWPRKCRRTRDAIHERQLQRVCCTSQSFTPSILFPRRQLDLGPRLLPFPSRHFRSYTLVKRYYRKNVLLSMLVFGSETFRPLGGRGCRTCVEKGH